MVGQPLGQVLVVRGASYDITNMRTQPKPYQPPFQRDRGITSTSYLQTEMERSLTQKLILAMAKEKQVKLRSTLTSLKLVLKLV